MQATTRGAVLRGGTVDELYDEVDANVPVAGYEDLPLSLIERDRLVFDPSSGMPRTVRSVTARLPGDVVVVANDRIRDNVTGRIYIVDAIGGTPRGISGRASVTLALRLTSG